MLYKTYAEAVSERRPYVSWRQVVIHKVTLSDGRTYYRTTEFDMLRHKCKRCRNARPKGFTSTGYTCTICGNPFAAKQTRNGIGRLH